MILHNCLRRGQRALGEERRIISCYASPNLFTPCVNILKRLPTDSKQPDVFSEGKREREEAGGSNLKKNPIDHNLSSVCGKGVSLLSHTLYLSPTHSPLQVHFHLPYLSLYLSTCHCAIYLSQAIDPSIRLSIRLSICLSVSLLQWDLHDIHHPFN